MEETERSAIVSIAELARRWGVEPSTVRNPRYRQRLGLPLIRVSGRFVGARLADIEAIEERGRELVQAQEAS